MTAMKPGLVIAMLCLLATTAFAHKPSDSHLSFDGLSGRLDVAVRDLDAAVALDANGDGAITWNELTAGEPRIATYIHDRLAIAECPYTLGHGALVDYSDGAYWSVSIALDCAPRQLVIRYNLLFDLDAQHRGIIRVDDSAPAVARDATPIWFPSHRPAGIRDGIWHALTGIDHWLFILCLIWPLRRTREVLADVTAFALASGTTLAIASTGLLVLPAQAASIGSAAVLGIFAIATLVKKHPRLAFELGLLHGFTLAAHATLRFDFGIELGLAALVLVTRKVACAISSSLSH